MNKAIVFSLIAGMLPIPAFAAEPNAAILERDESKRTLARGAPA